MTQENKELLLKDLCARLPYRVKCHFNYGSVEGDVTLSCIDDNVARFEYGWYGRLHVSIDANYIKPYLRLMSSMTEQEYVEYSKLWNLQDEFPTDADIRLKVDMFDYLNAHHFDYRGLIPKGLAIEVTKENNPYKE